MPVVAEEIWLELEPFAASAQMPISHIGAQPQKVSWGETFTALQSGVVDGAEAATYGFYEQKHFEIADRIVEAFAVAAFVISSGFMFLNVINRYLVLGLLRIWAANSERFRPAYVTIRMIQIVGTTGIETVAIAQGMVHAHPSHSGGIAGTREYAPAALPMERREMGIDPVHFGIIVCLNLGIGQQTPPALL